MRRKMFHDPFGRPARKTVARSFLGVIAALIAGSICPPQARSATPPFDNHTHNRRSAAEGPRIRRLCPSSGGIAATKPFVLPIPSRRIPRDQKPSYHRNSLERSSKWYDKYLRGK
jgi:hypothetical protein